MEHLGNVNKSSSGDFLLRAIKLVNPVLLTFAFFVTWKIYYYPRTVVPYMWKGEIVIVGIFLLSYGYLSHLYQGYWIHINKASEIIYSQILSAVITMFLMYLVMILLCKRIITVIPLLIMLVVQIIVIWSWANLSCNWYKKRYPRKRAVIIWDERPGLENVIKETGMDARINVTGIYSIDDIKKKGPALIGDAEWVFMCDLHSHDRNQLIKYCIANDIAAYVIPRIGDALMAGAENTHLMHLPILMVQRHPTTIEYVTMKRIFDIVISVAALVVLSPIILITSIAIKLDDGGDVFYRQERLTKNGASFLILKFRSMKMNAESDGVAVLSTGDSDDRITKVGHFIRKVRLDELPQLINVLKGEMSIVGPRPERPEIAKEYEKELPEFSLRLQMKAGVTGYAQVYGKYNSKPYDKLLMDLLYISRANLLEDFRILIATVKILFMAESTEGFSEDEAGKKNKHIRSRK